MAITGYTIRDDEYSFDADILTVTHETLTGDNPETFPAMMEPKASNGQ